MSAEASHEKCDRCATPVEQPVTYADEICKPYGAYVDGVCNHVPLCTRCVALHQLEVISEIRYARGHAGTFGYPDEVPITEIERTVLPRHGGK